MKTPFYGSRRIAAALCKAGYQVNRKRIKRLMSVMGIQAIYPKKNLSKGCKYHKKYPYLLRDLEIYRPDQVWSADITYVRMNPGFVYLFAIMDWFSRLVLAWELSNTLDTEFCSKALKRALKGSKPDIFNTDQGVQFTSNEFTGILDKSKVKISMDGRGRVFDNIFIERLWRTVKYEEVYLKSYTNVPDAYNNLKRYFKFYNQERLHSSLGYCPPCEIYSSKNINN